MIECMRRMASMADKEKYLLLETYDGWQLHYWKKGEDYYLRIESEDGTIIQSDKKISEQEYMHAVAASNNEVDDRWLP